MSPDNTRISLDLPVVPHSVRAFIERAVTDDRSLMTFVESPRAALRAAGVPVQAENRTRADSDRLMSVIGNLRSLVVSGKIARDFRFEDVFTLADSVAYQEQRSSSSSYAEVNFDHSQEGHSAVDKTSTEGGIKDNFSRAGLGSRRFDDITAPLLSPGDLAAAAEFMQAHMRVAFQE